jgi:hypothetical protein
MLKEGDDIDEALAKCGAGFPSLRALRPLHERGFAFVGFP